MGTFKTARPRPPDALTGEGTRFITFGTGPLRTSFEPQLCETTPGSWELTITVTRAGTQDAHTAGPATHQAKDYREAAKWATQQLLALARGMGVLEETPR